MNEFPALVVIPKCPYPLLGRDILTKVGAHIYFSPTWISVTDWEGKAIHILTMALVDDHNLFTDTSNSGEKRESGSLLQCWIQEIPEAWAEAGACGLAKH